MQEPKKQLMDDVRSPGQRIKPKLLVEVVPESKLAKIGSFFKGLKFERYKQRGVINKPRNLFSSKSFKYGALLVVVVILAGVGIKYIPFSKMLDSKESKLTAEQKRAEEILDMVITEDMKKEVDFIFSLEIVINGQKQAIPQTFGEVEGGKLTLSADSLNGDIRVQSSRNEKFFLKDFFTIWGNRFDSQCIFNHCASGGKKLQFYVNGEVNNEYDNYLLKDGDKIKIIFG